jgi:hypothetical protein
LALDVEAWSSWYGNLQNSSYWTVHKHLYREHQTVARVYSFNNVYPGTLSIWLKGGLKYKYIIVNGGTITDKNSTMTTVGTISSGSHSDDRIKHNEVHVNDGLHVINQLKPQKYIKTMHRMYEKDHHFELDASGNPLDASGNSLSTSEQWKIETGLIAQDIEKIDELKYMVVPGNMTDRDGNQVKTIEYRDIFVYNIAATQELSKQQQEDKAKIVDLETEVATLKSELAAIKAHLGL